MNENIKQGVAGILGILFFGVAVMAVWNWTDLHSYFDQPHLSYPQSLGIVLLAIGLSAWLKATAPDRPVIVENWNESPEDMKAVDPPLKRFGQYDDA